MAIKFKAIITVWPLQSNVKSLIYVWYYLKCSFWNPNWFSECCAMPQISTLLMEKIFPMEVLPSIRECGCTPTPQRLCFLEGTCWHKSVTGEVKQHSITEMYWNTIWVLCFTWGLVVCVLVVYTSTDVIQEALWGFTLWRQNSIMW